MSDSISLNSCGMNAQVFDNKDGTYTIKSRGSKCGSPIETKVITSEQLQKALAKYGNFQDSFQKTGNQLGSIKDSVDEIKNTTMTEFLKDRYEKTSWYNPLNPMDNMQAMNMRNAAMVKMATGDFKGAQEIMEHVPMSAMMNSNCWLV